MVAETKVEDVKVVTPEAEENNNNDMEVIVHPLVLLSTVDHYNRVAKDTKKRVIGVLLGTSFKGRIDITNSFGIPFEEDLRDSSVWYLDHNFLEQMYGMFKKINAKEKIVGFYSTGPKIKGNDLKIDEVFHRFCNHPVFVIIDVRPGVEGIPVQAYHSYEEVEMDGKEIHRTFKHIASTIGALEAEEVGVEHLLRDINDPSTSSLANQIKHKMSSLGGLEEKLNEMHHYLANVSMGKLPVNNTIVYNMQTIFNLLPNLNVEDLVRAMLIKTNDMHFVIYLSALIRSIAALHDLVKNKIEYKDMDEFGEVLTKDGDELKTTKTKEEKSTKENKETTETKEKEGKKDN